MAGKIEREIELIKRLGVELEKLGSNAQNVTRSLSSTTAGSEEWNRLSSMLSVYNATMEETARRQAAAMSTLVQLTEARKQAATVMQKESSVGFTGTPGGLLGRSSKVQQQIRAREEAEAIAQGRAVSSRYLSGQGASSSQTKSIEELKTEYKRLYDTIASGKAIEQGSLKDTERRMQAITEVLNKRIALQEKLNSAYSVRPAGGILGVSAENKSVQDEASVVSKDTSGVFSSSSRLKALGEADKDAKGLRKSWKDLDDGQKAAILSLEKYKKVLDLIKEKGLSPQDLKRITRDPLSGREELLFEGKDQATGKVLAQRALVDTTGQVQLPAQQKFRTGLQNIGRDMVQFATWSLAMNALTIPLQKLTEMMGTMVESEAKLVTATTAVNSSLVDSQDIFNTVAESANAAGESIDGTIEAFTLAYRATGGGASEVERYTTATKLMNDSLTLSKLSTLDQATAIDTLAAALRQTQGSIGEGNPLEQGSQLLDKWVRVSQVANVDLGTLATGFAVLGDSADAAGLSIDQLNGVIAAVAETGISSGKEAANTARALVSGLQSDKAEKELSRLGIATKDTAGNMRDFMDVMRQIKSLRDSGVLGDSDFSRLTLALGGGTRRQAAYTTFIENLSRVDEVAKESEGARGEAAAALAKQLDTVQTANQRLQNSFQKLAMSLGEDGGFLDITKGIFHGLTGLVDIFTLLTSSLGKATPALIAFGAAFAYLQTRTDKSKFLDDKLFSPLGRNVDKYFGTGYSAQDAREASIGLPPATRGQRVSDFVRTGGRSAGTAGMLGFGVGTGLMVAATPAIQNFTNAEDKYGSIKGTADLLGGAIGGSIGTALGGPIGAVAGASIGVAMAESFASTAKYSITELGTKVYEATKPEDITANKEQTPQEKINADIEKATTELFKSIGYGSEWVGEKRAENQAKSVDPIVKGINEALGKGDVKAAQEINRSAQTAFGPLLTQLGITEQTINEYANAGKQFGKVEKLDVAAAMAPGSATQALMDLLQQGADIGVDTGLKTTSQQEYERISSQYGKGIQGLIDTEMQKLMTERSKGNLKSSTYFTQSESALGFSTKGPQYLQAFGDAFDTLDNSISGSEEVLAKMFQTIVYGTPESINEINALVGEITTLKEAIASTAEGGTVEFGGESLTKINAQARLALLQEEAANRMAQEGVSTALRNKPDIYGSISAPAKNTDVNTVINMAMGIMRQQQQAFYPELNMEQYASQFDAFSQLVEDGGKEFYRTIQYIDEQGKEFNLDPKAFQAAWDKALKEGLIQGNEGLGLGQYDFSRQTLEAAADQSIGLSELWQRKFGYNSEITSQVAIDKEGMAKPLKADFKIMQMLLEKLVDQGQKQLDGMYNIPEGATFWVPISAAYYKPGTGENDQLSELEKLRNLYTGEGDNLATGTTGAAGAAAGAVTAPELTNVMSRNDLQKVIDQAQAASEIKDKITGAGTTPTTTPAAIENTMANVRKYGEETGVKDNAVNTTPTARIELTLNNTTTVMLDGAMLANIIQQRLASAMARMSTAYGNSTKNYVI